MNNKVLEWIDRILVFDVFLVLGGFIWFAIALIGRSAGIPLGWDLWYALWQPLFNPAISILIAGIVVSWAVKKLGQRFAKSETDEG
ncbi:hypothetical protein PN441_13545 [Spirulina major CS-329]|jgi:hypothetical protein|uniref:hypothetical protein n=1 Tax=Spirulina TaxID=1154 RepID=UPI00232BBC04|nr:MULTISPECIES: hypothetical protein [Spirulina]MDB9495447.1 hypothetical protein [Spirulina subsalsa CS-330]MDB9504095.1 hypothetical protein [Spirulina major CS-329]